MVKFMYDYTTMRDQWGDPLDKCEVYLCSVCDREFIFSTNDDQEDIAPQFCPLCGSRKDAA